MKILAIDDEHFMLTILQRALSRLGYERVTTCASARAALEIIADPQRVPDLILLDVNMPEMDGVQFLRALADQHYVGALILVSGEDERLLQSISRMVSAANIHALGHLVKPFRLEALEALIGKWKPPATEQRRVARQAFTADELRAAIEKDELVVHYQPIVVVSTGEVVGVEALVRWNHPTAGLVYPDQFIGIAESHGLIDDLTRAVLGMVLPQTRNWLDAGYSLNISVNVSAMSLASLDFPDLIAGFAADAGVPANTVVLEVTESRLMSSIVTGLDILNRLRLKRFRLSIDDFGTGHSSLAQLRDVPFDELKVDRSFVHGAASDGRLRAIVSASMTMARDLGMVVVGEGVEDRTDWEFLIQANCDRVQGYFVARPMPAANVVGWMMAWKQRLSAEHLVAG